mmetsp:Transcript_27009/g.43507  ORF Transcript_27009/g.43507 Transcript_27009/m.43507 type:complete len:244 (-) Transcript_27009:364-1095(-)
MVRLSVPQAIRLPVYEFFIGESATEFTERDRRKVHTGLKAAVSHTMTFRSFAPVTNIPLSELNHDMDEMLNLCAIFCAVLRLHARILLLAAGRHRSCNKSSPFPLPTSRYLSSLVLSIAIDDIPPASEYVGYSSSAQNSILLTRRCVSSRSRYLTVDKSTASGRIKPISSDIIPPRPKPFLPLQRTNHIQHTRSPAQTKAPFKPITPSHQTNRARFRVTLATSTITAQIQSELGTADLTYNNC